jgi:hypothetical protein
VTWHASSDASWGVSVLHASDGQPVVADHTLLDLILNDVGACRPSPICGPRVFAKPDVE